MEEEQSQSKIVVIPEIILQDKRFSPATKLVYARIAFFDEFWESSEKTAEYLGLKKYTVQEAKRVLERYGAIIETQNTGRGKRYMTCAKIGELLLKKELSADEKQKLEKLSKICIARAKQKNDNNVKTSQKPKSDLGAEKTGESSQIAKSEFGNCEVRVCKTRDIGKKEVRMKEEILSSKEDNGETPKNTSFQSEDFGEEQKASKQTKLSKEKQELINNTNSLKGLKKKTSEKQKSLNQQITLVETEDSRVKDGEGRVVGGNVLVERAYALWEEILGQPCKRDKWNSQAAWNMMRAKAKGEEWLRGMLMIVRECKKDSKADFRTKNIANLADLQKNWEYAMDWYRQQRFSKTKSKVIRL